ncbi:MAG TPA: ABC transporter ATP-binding protein [Candidatus Paceibacterota bacterium]|nr:ABC transporter ATP-binding protein [Verrucomicrobiota bacterium]HRY51617.1 ABC transporter ATP-binding protein [Candidatus Paceibacterota bacterium]HSA03382.1 ABC transporter ATP-binding protein [Candidatus Paceibacterota bacterium]
MNKNAIEIRGLAKRFAQFQLGPLDLTVPVGCIYGLIGPNGAGKTTTLDLVFGMGRHDSGQITVLGLDHRREEVAMKRQAAYVSPDLNYLAWGKVGRAIQFVRGFYESSWDHAYCDHLLQTMRLDCDDKIATLSFGGRTKLALVLALAWRPKVLILDEPTTGLDAVSRHQLFSELLALIQDEARTILISSHSLTDVERLADHVGMIKEGRMLLEGETSAILEAYRLVDLSARDERCLPQGGGAFVQGRDQQRWRMLLDTRKHGLETLESRGVKILSAAPISLEDLFVTLAQAEP